MIDLPAGLRTALTLGVLAVLLLVMLTWGWSNATAPLPGGGEAEDSGVCEPWTVVEGERLDASQVEVTILNAGSREGLAGAVMDGFVERGFREGTSSNAPRDTEVAKVQVWAADKRDPAVVLVRSVLPKPSPVREAPVDLVDLPGVVAGVSSVPARSRRSSLYAAAASSMVGAEPPYCFGSHQAPAGRSDSGAARMQRSSICSMRVLSSAVSAAGSSPVGCIGSPTSMSMRWCRDRSSLRPLARMRWVPHTTIGISGTSASAAMRTAPDLRSLMRKLWEIVASGKIPTSSPFRRASTAVRMEAAPASRSTSRCPKDRMNGPPTGLAKISFFAMNRV